MAFANSNVSDLIATGIESRSGEMADNVENNNPITAALKVKGRTRTFSGGHKILEELSFAENPNGGAYSGYDPLPVQPADVISAAEYNIRQYAVPVIVSGLELLQNAGKERILNLVEERITVAEDTMKNLLETGVYGDASGYQGKAIEGLGKYLPDTATASQSQTIGGISQSTWSFWRSYRASGSYDDPASTPAGYIGTAVNTAYTSLTRGADAPDLILFGSTMWGRFMAGQQNLQRFANPQMADIGFPSIKYIGADCVSMGGIGGSSDLALVTFVLNTKFLRWRPHSACNMVPLSPTRRYAVNMDAQVQILAWAGNFTCRGLKFQGRITSTD